MTTTGTHVDYSQTDPRWANKLQGRSTHLTLKYYGCLITAGASVAVAQGAQTDPGKLNKLLESKGLLGGSDGVTMLCNDFLTRCYPKIKFIERKDWPSDTVAPGKYFQVRTDLKTDLIIKLDYHPELPGIQEHWCRVIGTNAELDDVEIVDSFDGKRKWLSTIAEKGDKQALQIIWSALKYRGQ